MAAVRLQAARVCGPKAHTPEPPARSRIFWHEAPKNSSIQNNNKSILKIQSAQFNQTIVKEITRNINEEKYILVKPTQLYYTRISGYYAPENPSPCGLTCGRTVALRAPKHVHPPKTINHLNISPE